MEAQEDPFASITKLCQPTPSQEAKFPNCPLARESDNFSDSNSDPFCSSPDPTPSEPAAIVMVSPPASAQQPPEDDAVFHTPSEHHLPAYFSSDDLSSDRSKKARVLEGGSDDEPESKRIRSEFDGETVPAVETEAIEVIVLDSSVSGGETVNLIDKNDVVRRNGEVLGDGVWEVDSIDGNRELDKGKNKEIGCSEMDHENGVGGSEKVVVKVRKDGNFDRGGKSECKRIEEIDEFRYVKEKTSRDDVGGYGKKSQVPVAMNGGGKNVGGEKRVEAKSGLMEFLDVLKVMFADKNDGYKELVDILETAKRRGMTFPRPRWWPPEGEDE